MQSEDYPEFEVQQHNTTITEHVEEHNPISSGNFLQVVC